MAAALVTLEKSAKGGMQKFFKYVPAVVLCYLIAMLLCTLGVWDMAETKPAYSALKNNLTYAMIFAMLLRCNIRKVLKLGPKMLIGFFSATLTIMIGFVCAFVLMKGTIGSDVWMGLCALCGSWIGGSGNMVAMQDALPVDPGAYACALTLNTVCYSVWIALLIFMVRYSSKWDKSVKADTSKLSAIADVANEEVEKEKKAKATSGDWVWMIGLALIVSALSQWVGAKMGAGFAGMGLKMFDKGTCTTLFVTVLGLACAMTPLGKLPAANELSSVLCRCCSACHAGASERSDRGSDVGRLRCVHPRSPCCRYVHSLQAVPLGFVHGLHSVGRQHRRSGLRADHRRRLQSQLCRYRRSDGHLRPGDR